MNVSLSPSRPSIVFFVLVAGYLTLIGQWGLSDMTHYLDGVAVREAGFSLATSNDPLINLKRLYWGALDHRYGPVAFLYENISYWLLGKWLPLLSPTLQLPHIPLMVLACWLAWKVGEELGMGPKAWLIPTVLLLQGTVFVNIRTNFYATSLTIPLQLAITYLLVRFSHRNELPLHRLLLPLLVAIYPLIGLDWSLFLLCMGVYILFMSNRRSVLINKYNLIIIFSIIVYLYIIYNNFSGSKIIFLPLYLPFQKLMSISQPSSIIVVSDYSYYYYLLWVSFLGFGPLSFLWTGFPFAIVQDFTSRKGAVFSLFDKYLIERRFYLYIFAWFFIGVIFTIRLNNIQYAIFSIVPVAILSSRLLADIKPEIATLFVFANFLVNFINLFSPDLPNTPFSKMSDDVRVLAVAAFLNQERSDLLQEDKIAFLPNYLGASVGYHARGRNKRIIMPNYFPATRGRYNFPRTGPLNHPFLGDRNGSSDSLLIEFMDNYLNNGKISADWLVISPEHTQDQGGWFFSRISQDPQITWLVQLKDIDGRMVWLGEVTGKGNSLNDAPILSVESLARVYRQRYSGIDFMSKDWGKFVRF